MEDTKGEESKIKILLVDDSEIVLDSYQMGLSHFGYAVDVVDNSIKAQEIIANNNYDIVISDINMELMDGLELLEAVKRDYPHIEVIMMTGYGTVENAIRAMKNGAYDFLLKPIKLDQMGMVVGKCVEKIRMSQELKQLREVNQRFKELKQLKDRFMTITSHELRTPVTHIKSYLDLLEDPEFSEEERKSFFEILKKSVSDLERIVMTMFELYNVENQKLSLNLEPTQINEIVGDCLEQLSADLMQRDLAIEHNQKANIPEIAVDAFQIKKVVMELLNNAIRFTDDGGKICISYEISSDLFVLRIIDTGIGIPQAKLGRIFEKFYEVQDSNSHSSSRIDFMGGSIGVGLPLVKGIVEAHRGRLKIESQENDGTTVSVYLKPNPTKPESDC